MTVVQTPVKSDSDLGLISMVLSIISFIVLRIPLAVASLIISLSDKKKNGGVFTRYGKVGFICSLISLGISALTILGVLAYYAFLFILMLGAAGM